MEAWPWFDLCRGHQGTIWSLVANGGHLYSSSSDGSIKMWDIADFRRGCLRTVSAHKDCVSACPSPPPHMAPHMAPHGHMADLMQALCMVVGRGILYSAGTDLYIRSWNLESLEEIGSVQMAPAVRDVVVCMCFANLAILKNFHKRV